jgi:outer membrane protein assembly factor BamD (BamD/ComL family)
MLAGESDAKDAQTLYSEAFDLERRGEVQEAIRWYENIRKAFPDHPVAEDARINLKALQEKMV